MEIRKLPEQWAIHYGDLTFQLKPMSFKHTGLFPEQAANWDFIDKMIRHAGRPINVLNLFAYTGGATLAAANAGASVCHVDASKGMVQWAKENAASSGLVTARSAGSWTTAKSSCSARSAADASTTRLLWTRRATAAVRPARRGRSREDVADFIDLTMGVLSDKPLFVLISSYSTGLAPSVMSYLLGITAGQTRRRQD